jgi:ABC-type cobalamin/Fe3+-siderophores transport system ATPase subunit
MSTPEGTPRGSTAPRGHDAGELLRLTGVSKSYRRGSQELCVLREVSLDVRAGQLVCVLATHGEGKTTLLRIAAGIESADAGLVSFDGQDLAACSDPELSRLLGERIAWVGKRGPRTGVQMFDYIAMPLLARGGEGAQSGNWIRRWLTRRAYRRGVDARVRGALERVGAAGCAKQQWETMSDWERALVELAHGIAGDPEVLLLDDVTDNLGILETEDFIALVRAISKERALGVLMSVSDHHATVLSDRIMRLSGGRLTQAPQRAVRKGLPPGAGNVLDFPGVGSDQLEAGHARSS